MKIADSVLYFAISRFVSGSNIDINNDNNIIKIILCAWLFISLQYSAYKSAFLLLEEVFRENKPEAAEPLNQRSVEWMLLHRVTTSTTVRRPITNAHKLHNDGGLSTFDELSDSAWLLEHRVRKFLLAESIFLVQM